MKILLTGGSGRLGKEIRKLIKVHAPSHRKLDIVKGVKKEKYDLVIHAAAYTDVAKAENKGLDDCFNTNIWGTLNMVKAYRDTPFVFISSEYAFHPVNFYSLTKLVGEQMVANLCKNYLIIRTLFKPRPYPYGRAWVDQWTIGDYVDVIAPLIVKKIKKWDGKNRTVYVGTGRKTIFDLARQTRPDVKPAYIEEVIWVKLPRDYK